MTDAATISANEDPSLAAPPAAPEGGDAAPARSLTQDAWRQLRRKPIFWISVVLITVFLLMALFPQLFTNKDPEYGDLYKSMLKPGEEGSLFGYDLQGKDIYARCVYGARASIMVGVLTTIATTTLGSLVGLFAGFYGGWLDALLSRVTDMVFAIPMLLGGILFMTSFPSGPDTPYMVIVGKLVLVLMIFGWPGIARLMRSSVLQIKENEYVQAARALGASPARIITQHILPNAMAPVIVVATINLGAYIAAEATLSYLGIGLVPPAISWGSAISAATDTVNVTPHILLFPSLFLSLCVLAFMTLGDAVRDAFDPKQR